MAFYSLPISKFRTYLNSAQREVEERAADRRSAPSNAMLELAVDAQDELMLCIALRLDFLKARHVRFESSPSRNAQECIAIGNESFTIYLL